MLLLCFTMLRKEGWTQPKGAGYLHPWDCETISYTITCILNIYHIQLYIDYCATISYTIIHCFLWNYILYNYTLLIVKLYPIQLYIVFREWGWNKYGTTNKFVHAWYVKSFCSWFIVLICVIFTLSVMDKKQSKSNWALLIFVIYTIFFEALFLDQFQPHVMTPFCKSFINCSSFIALLSLMGFQIPPILVPTTLQIRNKIEIKFYSN